MIVSPLLEKTRQLNKILQKEKGRYVDYKEIAIALKDVIMANVFLLDLQGSFLGYALADDNSCEISFRQVKKGCVTDRANAFLLQYDELHCNLKKEEYHGCIFTDGVDCPFVGKVATLIPIIGRDRRLGTMFLTRFSEPFTEEDLILAEGGATLVAMEILREEIEESEEELRHSTVVKLALEALSYSEMEVIEQFFKDFTADEGLMVASRIADSVGIARSVAVNALRKLESAGILESWTLGTKGTYIKVHNPYLFKYLGSRSSFS